MGWYVNPNESLVQVNPGKETVQSGPIQKAIFDVVGPDKVWLNYSFIRALTMGLPKYSPFHNMTWAYLFGGIFGVSAGYNSGVEVASYERRLNFPPISPIFDMFESEWENSRSIRRTSLIRASTSESEISSGILCVTYVPITQEMGAIGIYARDSVSKVKDEVVVTGTIAKNDASFEVF